MYLGEKKERKEENKIMNTCKGRMKKQIKERKKGQLTKIRKSKKEEERNIF